MGLYSICIKYEIQFNPQIPVKNSRQYFVDELMPISTSKVVVKSDINTNGTAQNISLRNSWKFHIYLYNGHIGKIYAGFNPS